MRYFWAFENSVHLFGRNRVIYIYYFYIIYYVFVCQSNYSFDHLVVVKLTETFLFV